MLDVQLANFTWGVLVVTETALDALLPWLGYGEVSATQYVTNGMP